MDASPTAPVVAIDGGGSRCRIAFSDHKRVVSVETGPANVSTDFDGAVGEIRRGLALLSDRLGIPVSALEALPAYIGLAGVTGDRIAARLGAALAFRCARIEDDRAAALRGALGRRDGAIAHCGTGTFYGSKIGTAVRLAGGWGPVLGDEASAQWIGRSALGVALEAADGRRTPSPLTDRILAEHGGTAEIVRFAGTARPPDFGRTAPLVTELAAGGDPNAVDIMAAGAAEIARALPKIGWVPGLPICLTGGIGPHYRSYLPAAMQGDVTSAEAEPLDGAIALARDLAEEGEHACH